MVNKQNLSDEYKKCFTDIFKVLADKNDTESIAIIGGTLVLLLKSIEIAIDDDNFGKNYLSNLIDKYIEFDTSKIEDFLKQNMEDSF